MQFQGSPNGNFEVPASASFEQLAARALRQPEYHELVQDMSEEDLPLLVAKRGLRLGANMIRRERTRIKALRDQAVLRQAGRLQQTRMVTSQTAHVLADRAASPVKLRPVLDRVLEEGEQLDTGEPYKWLMRLAVEPTGATYDSPGIKNELRLAVMHVPQDNFPPAEDVPAHEIHIKDKQLVAHDFTTEASLALIVLAEHS